MMSSDDILLQIPHVKYKKDVGTFLVMSDRVAWFQESIDNMVVSHKYEDIKSQKISSEGKPKIQLQVVLFDNTAYTFQFVNPNGQAAQLEDREQIKTLIMQLLPKFRKQLNRDLEDKNTLLRQNPSLLKLYKELVQNNIITSEEFWKTHAQRVTKDQQNTSSQNVGISSGFLSGIKPETDGANGIRYNLSKDIIQSIFKTYPAVKRKHAQSVPAEMTESQFWTKFFQSHYYHRDRLPVIKDLFSDCAKHDDKIIRKEIQKIKEGRSGTQDMLSVLEGAEASEASVDFDALNDTASKSTDGKSKEKDKAVRVTHQGMHKNMIKRFNQHSIMVLKASTASSESNDGNSNPLEENGHANTDNNITGTPPESEDTASIVAHKKAKLSSEILLEDLQEGKEPNYQRLKLTKLDRYLNGPVPLHRVEPVTPEQIHYVVGTMKEYAPKWENIKPRLLDAKSALKVIEELSPGGNMMRKHHNDSNNPLSVSFELKSEFRSAYLSVLELLKHFYACFPVTSPALEEKLKKTFDTLSKFEAIKMEHLKERVAKDQSLSPSLLNHISLIIQAAKEKFNQWQQRTQQVITKK